MTTEEIDLRLIPQSGPFSRTIWVNEEACPPSWPVEGAKLSLLQYSGHAVAGYVRIGDEKLDQFSSASIGRGLLNIESETLLRSIPLFQELELYEAEICLDVTSMSEVHKGPLVYIVFVESWSDGELATILAETPVLFRGPEYIIFKKRWALRTKSCFNERVTFLLFGYMTNKRPSSTPSFSSSASRSTPSGGSAQVATECRRAHLHQYVEALRHDGPYAFGEKPADRNRNLLSNLDSIISRLQ